MLRRLRFAPGGYAYHVLNRGVGKMRLFAKEGDFEAFEEIIGQAKERLPTCGTWSGTRFTRLFTRL